MASKVELRQLRNTFRDAVLDRDEHRCIFCAAAASEAHHITDRSEMPNDGYAVENGATLCEKHHLMAEQFHISGGRWWCKGMHPDDIYTKVGSSRALAEKASRELL